MWLLWLFVFLPIVEIALFVQIGGLIGVLPVLALVIASTLAGVAVMRSQGGRAVQDVQQAMRDMRDPTQPMAHGALRMIGGVLLVLPGFLTSSLGLLLLVPAVRRLILRRMSAHVRVVGSAAGYSRQTWTTAGDFAQDDPAVFRRRSGWDDGIIDGEYSVQDDPPGPVRDHLTDQRPTGDSSGRRGNSGWTRH